MWAVLRWLYTNPSGTLKTPWVTLRCATCVALILLVYARSSFGAASDEGSGSAPLPLSLFRSGPSAQHPGAASSDDAKQTVGATNDFTRGADTSVKPPVQGASATRVAAEKLRTQKAKERKRAFQELARQLTFSRRHQESRFAERERAFQIFTSTLNGAHRQTREFPSLPAPEVPVVQPVSSETDSQQTIASFPLLPHHDRGEISLALAHLSGSGELVELQKTEVGRQQEGKDATFEALPVVASTNALVPASVGKEQNEVEPATDTGLKLAASLEVKVATFFFQSRKLSSEVTVQHEEAETGNKNGRAEDRQPAIQANEASGDMNKTAHTGKGEIEGGIDPKKGAWGLYYRVNEPAGKKKASENNIALNGGKVIPPAKSMAKKRRVPREGKDGANLKRNPGGGPGGDRDIGEGKVRNRPPVQAVPRTQMKEAEAKGHGQRAEGFIPPLSLPKELNPATKQNPTWPAVPGATFFGGTFLSLRRPSEIRRQKAAQVREARKWKGNCRSKGWKMCGKRHNAAKDGLPRHVDRDRNSSDTDAYTTAWAHHLFPRPLPRTSSSSLSLSQHLGPSIQEEPRNTSGQGVNQMNQPSLGANALGITLFDGDVPYALRPVGDNEGFRPAGALNAALGGSNMPYQHAAAGKNDASNLHVPVVDYWHHQYNPGHNPLPHEYPGVVEMPQINFTEFPFPRGPLSIPSSTSSMSCGFGGIRKTIRPLPPMLLTTSESPATYSEPLGHAKGRTETDSGFWVREHTSHSPSQHTHLLQNGDLNRNIAGNETPGESNERKKEEDTRGGETEAVERERLERQAEMTRVDGDARAKDRIRKNNPTRQNPLQEVRQEKQNRTKRAKNQTTVRMGVAGIRRQQLPVKRRADRGATVGAAFKRDQFRMQIGGRLAKTRRFSRAGKLRTATKRSKRRSIKKTIAPKRVPVILPAKEQRVVDEKARLQVGERAERLRRKPLIERTSTQCLDVMSEILTPGTTITFEPRPDAPKEEHFSPMSLIWGTPLGAGANGIVYEVSSRSRTGKRVRYALKLALNRHQSVCNAWTKAKRGELTLDERMKFEHNVQRVCHAEYEAEMRQRRLLSLPAPSPSTVSNKDDVGKLFAEKQVCVPLAVGRIRGLSEYTVCTGGNVALVNVAGLTPAASCNLYQILAAFDLTVPEKYELTRQVITAVSNVHSLGLLHKDLKSENLVVTSRGDVIVADLAGAEPLVHGEAQPAENFDPGTVTFVAPERAAARLGRQSASAAITVKANSWSLGMIVYEIWCKGIDPFHLETLTDKEVLLRLDNMLRRHYPLSFSSCPPVPRMAQTLISSLLQADPRRRKAPAHLMWTLPLLRKREFLGRRGAVPGRSKRG